jgi:ABC-type Fe3+ transport system permease subunit
MSTELSPAMRRSDPLIVLRYLDVVLVVLAAPFVLLTGLPVLGFVVGAVVWIAQRLVSTRVEAYLRQESDIRRQVGIGLGMSLGRAFVVGLSILAVGLLGARADGAMAAILVLAAFTVYFVTSLVIRPLERNTPRP